MEDVSAVNKGENYIELPPGFRFHPTDEEIITHYLSPKVLNHGFSSPAIGEADLNKCEPWDLPSKAKMGEKEWYLFCQRDRKYPTGMRTNRATESGYWKSTGKDKEIFRGEGVLVGMKKTLVFYKGRAPKGEKMNWVMHEFRIEGKYLYSNPHGTSKDEWVVCRVLHKNMGVKKTIGFARMNSFIGEHALDSPTLPSVMDSHYLNSLVTLESLYIEGDEDFDLNGIATISTSTPSYFPTMVDLCSNINYQANSFNQSSDFYPQIPPVNPYFSETEMLRTSAIIGSHCKAQQFSEHSVTIASQDTGLSNDRNIEISSAMVLTQEMGGYDDFEDPSSSAEPVMNLENMWGC